MAINQRQKGATFERKIANLLKAMGVMAKRGQQHSGVEGEDVISDLPWNIECKAVEALNLAKAYEQSKRDADKGKIPVVIHKKNNKPIMLTMALDDFPKAAGDFVNVQRGKKLDNKAVQTPFW